VICTQYEADEIWLESERTRPRKWYEMRYEDMQAEAFSEENLAEWKQQMRGMATSAHGWLKSHLEEQYAQGES